MDLDVPAINSSLDAVMSRRLTIQHITNAQWRAKRGNNEELQQTGMESSLRCSTRQKPIKLLSHFLASSSYSHLRIFVPTGEFVENHEAKNPASKA